MDRALIEREIAGLLVAMGLRAERLRPEARLLQDLRVDGDDAAEFFAAIAARFGTDLSALRANWDSHFGAEGLSITAAAPVALASAATGAIAALAGVPGVLCAVPAAMGGAAVWLAGGATGAGRLRPIRLGEVADAVERGCWDGTTQRTMAKRLPIGLWLAALACAVTGPAARAATDPPTGPDIRTSVCPASRRPIPVGDPRLAGLWSAAAAFDRAGHGFSPLPATGDVILEQHPDAGSAVIHTCQPSSRAYRTIHFRVDRSEARWIGEQQSFRSGRTFEDSDAGTVLEELILDYETEPIAGFPLNRLNILYRGPVTEKAGPSASPSLEQARLLLRRWGF